MATTEPGSELFCDIVVECIGCKLKRTVQGLARQGVPIVGTVVVGPLLFGASCLRCGVEKFKILEKPTIGPLAPAVPVGWVKRPG